MDRDNFQERRVIIPSSDLLAWLTGHLPDESIHHIDEVRSGPAATVYAVQMARRRCYLKECAPPYAFEPGLTAALAACFPADIPAVMAVDDSRRWLLLADAGETVKSLSQADGDLTRWDEMLRRFARLQQAAPPYRDLLLAHGVADRRLASLPAQFEQIAADTPALLIGEADGFSEADYARLRDFAPTVRQLCAAAAGYAVPETLHHDDFHAGNVALRDGQYRFFDWGESCLAHPFYSLVMTLRYARYVFNGDTALLDHLRDVYLECWLDYEPLPRLRELLAITNQLAALCRALTWWTVVPLVAPEYRADLRDSAPYWLLTFLNNTPLEA
jgi:hypothetical protein